MAAVKQIRTRGKLPRPTARRAVGSPLDNARGFEVVWPQVSGLFDASRNIVGRSFVYVIGEEDAGPIKIGVAKDPIARLRNMQTCNPRQLRIEYVVLGDATAEKLMHDIWEDFRIGHDKRATEWFEAGIREELPPVMVMAAEQQVEYLADREKEVRMTQLERIIHQAHIAHDRQCPERDEVRLLAANGHGIVKRSVARP